MKDTPLTEGREHLHPSARPLLDCSGEERIEFVWKERWVPYPRAERILARMEDLLRRPRTDRMPNLLVVGDTNNGKTALLRRFRKRHPCVENSRRDGNAMPVVYVQAPPVPDEGRFYGRILDALIVPYRTSDRVEEKEKQVVRMTQRLEVRMLMVDEIHHIIAGSTVRQRHFRNVIKILGNTLQIPIIAAGTQDAFNAVNSDGQLANRFTPALLPRWTAGENWDRLVLSMERYLPLQKRSRLVENASAKLLEMTGGAIGELSNLLNTAAEEAIRSSKERIDKKLLDSIGWVPPKLRKLGGDAASGDSD